VGWSGRSQGAERSDRGAEWLGGGGGGYWEGAGICRNWTKALQQSAVRFCDILTISARVEKSGKIENT